MHSHIFTRGGVVHAWIWIPRSGRGDQQQDTDC